MATRESRYAGFTIIEAMLVVVTVAVIGVTGWFVIKHNQAVDTKAASGSTPSNNQQTSTSTTTYFTISEWGVKAPYSGSLKLSYTLVTDSTGNSSATFSSGQLSALSTDCVGFGGAITRLVPTAQYAEGNADASTPSVAAFFQGKDRSVYNYAHIGGYYYVFRHPQSQCGDPSSIATLESQTIAAVKALVTQLQPVTN